MFGAGAVETTHTMSSPKITLIMSSPQWTAADIYTHTCTHTHTHTHIRHLATKMWLSFCLFVK